MFLCFRFVYQKLEDTLTLATVKKGGGYFAIDGILPLKSILPLNICDW